MLIYTAPSSPKSWLGKEDFWLIGEQAAEPIKRKWTGGLFNCLLYPTWGTGRSAQPMRPAEIGLRVCSRADVGVPTGLNLAGGNSPGANIHRLHTQRFGEETLASNVALMQAAGVLAVVQDVVLVTELCSDRNYRPIPEIVPAFAESLSRLTMPR